MDRLHRCIPSQLVWIIRVSGRSTRSCTIDGRAQYVPVTDDEAVDSFEYLSRMEGIIPAVESAHAVAYARKMAGSMDKDRLLLSIFPAGETRMWRQLPDIRG